jgi:AraC family transcriptional regulator
MLKPKFVTIEAKKLVGMNITTNLQDDNSTTVLWKGFMPNREKIQHAKNMDLFSIQEYDAFVELTEFNEQSPFRKWAAIEVREYENIPEGMHTIDIPAGEYAVFTHKGPTSTFMHIKVLKILNLRKIFGFQ